ncbi:MAG TPA: hypothetical protein VGJ60_25460 [Chloroflexota bacterium]|jgi:predicted outer membrane lipoprotein
MNLYSAALFLHVVAAFGIVTAMCLELALVVRMRQASTAEQVCDWMNLLRVIRVLSPVSFLILLVAGFYMASAWEGAAWVVVAFLALVFIAVFGAITGRSLPGTARDLANHHGPLSVELRERLRNPLPLASIQIRITMVLGIVFLMTTKPDVTVSIGTIVLAAALGAVSSIPAINKTAAVVHNEAAR